MRALATFVDIEKLIQLYPPAFIIDSPGKSTAASDKVYSLIGRHLSMRLVDALMFKKFPAECIDRASLSVEALAKTIDTYAWLDMQLYAGINAKRPSRPTKVRLKRIAKKQTCPVCHALSQRKQPLSGPKDWRRAIKLGQLFIIKCRKCKLELALPRQIFELFMSYTLPTRKFLIAQYRGTEARTCSECDKKKRKNGILLTLKIGRRTETVCSNGLRPIPTCSRTPSARP